MRNLILLLPLAGRAARFRPVLDVYGEKDSHAVLASAPARRASLQVRIAGADHFYNGREAELAAVLQDFISGL